MGLADTSLVVGGVGAIAWRSAVARRPRRICGAWWSTGPRCSWENAGICVSLQRAAGGDRRRCDPLLRFRPSLWPAGRTEKGSEVSELPMDFPTVRRTLQMVIKGVHLQGRKADPDAVRKREKRGRHVLGVLSWGPANVAG